MSRRRGRLENRICVRSTKKQDLRSKHERTGTGAISGGKTRAGGSSVKQYFKFVVSTTDFSAEQYGSTFIVFQIFEEIDTNRDGVLEMSEVMAKFREKGYRDSEIDEFLRLCDLDKSGTVSLDEFLAAFSQFVAKARSSLRA